MFKYDSNRNDRFRDFVITNNQMLKITGTYSNSENNPDKFKKIFIDVSRNKINLRVTSAEHLDQVPW